MLRTTADLMRLNRLHLRTGTLALVTALLVSACAETTVVTAETTVVTTKTAAEQAYLDQVEGYARDLLGIDSVVVSESDVIETGHLMCEFLSAGGDIRDLLLELLNTFDTTVDQPLTEQEFIAVAIYEVTAASDNFCPEHRGAVNDFLDEGS